MTCRARPRWGALILCVAWALAGCGDPADDLRTYSPPAAGGKPGAGVEGSSTGPSGLGDSDKAAVLDSVLTLIESAALAPLPPPGSQSNFSMASSHLNYYFEGAPDSEFTMDPPARQYLLANIREGGVASLEGRKFTDRDARHIEDCLLYHGIAARVAGDGDDLTRVGRLFDWVARQVQLVPVGTLVPPGLPQAQARPYDVLIRGVGSEEAGDASWAERSWSFIVLCRQIHIDAGFLALKRPGSEAPERWITTALVDGKPYLFDARLGLPVPGPGGKGVATLEQAATDPEILRRLDLPGLAPYGVSAADLAGKVRVLIDSSTGYASPRMRALQQRLASRNRMVLYRDPAAQRDAFLQALGARVEDVSLWTTPLMVETRLFTDPAFNRATGYTLQMFNASRFSPLLRGRLAQLRGLIDGESGAIRHYVSFRKEENLSVPDPRNPEKKLPVPPAFRRALDLYATQFLAQCHLDRGRPGQARFLFEQTLVLQAQPGAGALDPPFRDGALANLGRLAEDAGQVATALACYAAEDPTGQRQGDLLRSVALLWRDPTLPPVDPPPAAPATSEPAGGYVVPRLGAVIK